MPLLSKEEISRLREAVAIESNMARDPGLPQALRTAAPALLDAADLVHEMAEALRYALGRAPHSILCDGTVTRGTCTCFLRHVGDALARYQAAIGMEATR
ncbi:MAG: hypothetical protein KGR26_13565 [Cyanobacteria bacterium REEB65]|nr:hypothetical protein [Cyanobacteria bacterium REEB65]